jgi:hypothetical protein
LRIQLDYRRLESVCGLHFSDEDRSEIELLARLLIHSEANPGPFVFPKSVSARASRKAASAGFMRIKKKSEVAAQRIDELLSALGGINGPLGRIYLEINRLPPYTTGSGLLDFARSPQKGFGRLMTDLDRGKRALRVIGYYAGIAAKGSIGKGAPRGPKGYPLFRSVLQNLHQVFRRSGGKGHGAYYDDVCGCYKGPFLGLACEFISQLKPSLGGAPFAVLPPWIQPCKQVQASGAREEKRLGAYITKQVIPKSR